MAGFASILNKNTANRPRVSRNANATNRVGEGNRSNPFGTGFFNRGGERGGSGGGNYSIQQGTPASNPLNQYSHVIAPLYGDALGLYHSGAGYKPYPKDRVADMAGSQVNNIKTVNQLAGDTSMYGDVLSGLRNQALGGAGWVGNNNGALTGIASGANSIGTASQWQDLVDNPAHAYQTTAGGSLTGLSTDGSNPFQDEVLGIFREGGQTAYNDPVRDNLTNMASDKYLEEGNPYYRERLQTEIGDAMNDVSGSFSGVGRSFSGMHQDVATRRANQMRLQGLEADYNRAMQNKIEANRQLQAAADTSWAQGQQVGQNIQGLGDTQNNLRLQGSVALGGLGGDIQGQKIRALQGLTDVQNQNIQNQMGASTANLNAMLGAKNNAVSAANAIPGVTNTRMGILNNGLSASGLYQGQRQNEINADMAYWNELQQEPWNRLTGTLGLVGSPFTKEADPGWSSSGNNWLQNIGAGLSLGNSAVTLGRKLF